MVPEKQHAVETLKIAKHREIHRTKMAWGTSSEYLLNIC
jgi:hypothetical protein